MRTKEELLNESHTHQAQNPASQIGASTNARLIIEVLIDIRDQLSALTTILGSVEKVAYRSG